MQSDPQFVARATLDLHLRSTSPAIDRGTAESVDAGYPVDFDGNVVPQGSAPEIGAYAFGTSSATPTPPLAPPTPTGAPTATPTPPLAPPTPTAAPIATPTSAVLISTVATADQTSTSAVVSWTTSAPGTSRVAYGMTSAELPFSTVEDQQLTTAHSVALTNVLGNTRYYYRVYSKDAAGVEYTSAVYSFWTKNR